MTRHVFFYSEFCQFSKDVMALITKKNVSTLFLPVCVDTYREMLPVFVHSVPTIFTHDKRVLEGQAAYDLIDNMQQARDSVACGAEGSGLPIECSTHDLSGSSWSDGFAFLEPSPSQSMGLSSGMSAFSGLNENTSIPLVPETSNGKDDRNGMGNGQGQGPGQGQGSGYGGTSALEAFTSKRDSETAVLRQNQLGSGPHQQQRRV